MVDASTQTHQCPLFANYFCVVTMVSKLWTYFGVLISNSDHGQDRTYRRQSHITLQHHCFPSHRRLLHFSLLIILLAHLSLVLGARVGSSKRRITSNGGKTLAEWDDIFQQRTDGDWRDLWHKERHRRCQHQLLSHMELVCEKDIYKLARRKRKKRDLADGESSNLGIDNSPAPEQQEDIDRGVVTDAPSIDSDLDSHFFAGPSMVNMTTRSMKQSDFPKHSLFSTYKEANLFGRRHLLKTRKRQLNSGLNSFGGNLVALGAKRSSRIERAKRGISDECCSGTDGCSWEEYAEYCPANVRIRTSVN